MSLFPESSVTKLHFNTGKMLSLRTKRNSEDWLSRYDLFLRVHVDYCSRIEVMLFGLGFLLGFFCDFVLFWLVVVFC